MIIPPFSHIGQRIIDSYIFIIQRNSNSFGCCPLIIHWRNRTGLSKTSQSGVDFTIDCFG